MPAFDNVNDDMMVMTTTGPGTFEFSAVKPENLGASEYTIVTLAVDVSGSTYDFINQVQAVVKTVIEACKKSPRSDNLLFRVITFNNSIVEVHGFKELHMIDIANYPTFNAHGMTALYDASYSCIGAVLDLADNLIQQDFSANGIAFILTDGRDNASKQGPESIKNLIDEAAKGEKIESMNTILIGEKDPQVTSAEWANGTAKYLADFASEAGFTQYIDIGEITPGKLAKFADFVSQSISTQSQGLGTGAPSKPVDLKF